MLCPRYLSCPFLNRIKVLELYAFWKTRDASSYLSLAFKEETSEHSIEINISLHMNFRDSQNAYYEEQPDGSIQIIVNTSSRTCLSPLNSILKNLSRSVHWTPNNVIPNYYIIHSFEYMIYQSCITNMEACCITGLLPGHSTTVNIVCSSFKASFKHLRLATGTQHQQIGAFKPSFDALRWQSFSLSLFSLLNWMRVLTFLSCCLQAP